MLTSPGRFSDHENEKTNLQISNDKKELKNAKQKLENLLLLKNPFIDKIGKLIEEKKEFLNKREIANSAKSTALNQKVPLAKNEMKKLDDDIEEAIKKVAEKELSIDELQSYLTKCNHDIENLQKSIIDFEKNVSFLA